jgi:hypothetical protein
VSNLCVNCEVITYLLVGSYWKLFVGDDFVESWKLFVESYSLEIDLLMFIIKNIDFFFLKKGK